MKRLFLAGIALALAACGNYHDDLVTMCEAPAKADLSAATNAAEKAVLMAAWIDQRLKTAEGKMTFAAIATMEPKDRGASVRKEAAAYGITTCAWGDWYDAALAEKAKADAAKALEKARTTTTATVAP